MSLERRNHVFHLLFQLFSLFSIVGDVSQVRCFFDDLEDLAENGLWPVLRVLLATSSGDLSCPCRDDSFRGCGTVRRSTLIHASAAVDEMQSHFRWLLFGCVAEGHLHLDTARIPALRTAFVSGDFVFFVCVRPLLQKDWMTRFFKPSQSLIEVIKCLWLQAFEVDPFAFACARTVGFFFFGPTPACGA